MTEKNSDLRVREDDLGADGDIVLYNGVPFTGIGYDLHPDGKLAHEVAYKDGFPDGVWREWYVSGQTKLESECRKGLKHGRTTYWFPNGAVKSVANFELGIKLNGKEWNEAGNLVKEYEILPGSPNYKLLESFRTNEGD